jgi:hypothetical protein
MLPLFVPMRHVAAQEVSAAVLSSTPSPSPAFPAPQPAPLPQAIRDAAVKDTWELGLGFTVVGFRSAPFNATASGLNTTLSYYFRDHLAMEGSFASAFAAQNSTRATAKYVFYGAGVKNSAGAIANCSHLCMHFWAECICSPRQRLVTTDWQLSLAAESRKG